MLFVPLVPFVDLKISIGCSIFGVKNLESSRETA